VFEIRKINIDENLKVDLLNILEVKKKIIWSDFAVLKKKYKITPEIIVAFVLQNKLNFVGDPFVIRNKE
jgi:hypothetical protein